MWEEGDWKSRPAGWQGSSGWRDGPYAQQQVAVRAEPKVKGASVFKDCMQALGRSEASARTAARVARSAALAFEEEASILSDAMKKLDGVMNAMGER